jgi:hypothetical protein
VLSYSIACVPVRRSVALALAKSYEVEEVEGAPFSLIRNRSPIADARVRARTRAVRARDFRP